MERVWAWIRDDEARVVIMVVVDVGVGEVRNSDVETDEGLVSVVILDKWTHRGRTVTSTTIQNAIT